MQDLSYHIKSYFGFEDKALPQVAQLFTAHTLLKNEYHTKLDAYCNRLSIVEKGYLRVYTYSDEGKEITQWISGPGQFVTELSSIIFEKPSRWHIQAITDCRLHSISKLTYHQIDQVVSDWPRLEKLFIAKCFTTLEERVFAFLSKSAEQRYEDLFQWDSELFNNVPLQYLASMLGMTPETLSRIRKKKIQ